MSERFLANENFPVSTVEWLRREGHDVIHAAQTMTGASDGELMERARSENRIILTFDRDFGELVFRQRRFASRGIVLFRLRQQSPETVLRFLEEFFEASPELQGFLTVASPGQFRRTPLPG